MTVDTAALPPWASPKAASLAAPSAGVPSLQALLCHWLAKNLHVIEALLVSGASVNAADYDQRTCIHLAASEGLTPIVEFLASAKADLSARDRWGGTPLRDAVREGHSKAAAALTRCGAELGLSEAEVSGEMCEAAKVGHLKVIEALIAAGVPDAVDVEIFRDEAVVDRIIAAAHAADVKVIASNHEFGHTPAAEELVRRLLLMERRGADVLKIAVMPKSPGDVLALLGATWTTSQQATRPLITMSMTATGVVSRLAGGTFGSCATFGTVGKASAPGQIPVAQLRAALAIVHAE